MATNIVYFYGQPVVTEKNVRYKAIKRAFRLSPKAHLFCVGGVGGIRTHARGKPSNDLATISLATYSL